MSPKRYSNEEARTIMARLRGYSFEDLGPLFKEGKTPFFEEIEGDTAGTFLAWNPKASRWMKLLTGIAFDNPFARWTGKRFITPFDEEKRGKGVNLYQNRILPYRYQFDTCIQKALLDQNSCLALHYAPFPSPMFGTLDELRRIEGGVFLGQAHHKFPWEEEHSFLVYFVLCALT
jgi:hypothetical protein